MVPDLFEVNVLELVDRIIRRDLPITTQKNGMAEDQLLALTHSSKLVPFFSSRTEMLRKGVFMLLLCRSRGFAWTTQQQTTKKHAHKTRRSMAMSSRDPFSKDLISSPKSKSVRLVQNLLAKRKKRLEMGQTVVEGPKIVLELLANPFTQSLVQKVFVSEDDYLLDYHEKLSSLGDSQLQLVTSELMKSMTTTVSPQGIVAIVDIPSYTTVPTSQNPIYLVLDGVSDPGNVGTLLRSSLAVGCSGVIFLPGSCDPWSPKVVRSAMGSSFSPRLPIVHSPCWQSALATLQSWNVENVYAATMIDAGRGGTESKPHFSIDWLKPSALVIGNEGAGLNPDIRKAINDHKTNLKAVHVPMCPGIESLNAAVCGSVILFEYSRQCRRTA
eukprot:scaffold3450_cov114-Cylindrotheca_fusiformis.AAC.47